jgi:hypothetical protein
MVASMGETRAFVVHQTSHSPKEGTNDKHENQFFQRADGIIEQTAGAAGRLGARSNTAAARQTDEHMQLQNATVRP